MVDIVIVNWNSGHYLKKCVDSVFAANNQQAVQSVIIIDNNSQDDSLKNISASTKIKQVVNADNAGFAKACNQGFKLCTAEFVLLLNPDAQLLPETLNQCIAFMKQRTDIDIMGAALLDDEGKLAPSCSRFPSAIRVYFDACGLSKIAPKLFTPATIMTDWDHSESRFVDQVMGAFMFMRTNIFDKAGYFDERFFVYFEEVDFCKRVTALGGKIFFNRAIEAIHSGEGTTKSVKAFRLFLSLRSRLLFAKKHFSVLGYALVWVSTFFIEPISRFCFLLLKGDIKGVKETAKGFGYLIKNKGGY